MAAAMGAMMAPQAAATEMAKAAARAIPGYLAGEAASDALPISKTSSKIADRRVRAEAVVGRAVRTFAYRSAQVAKAGCRYY